MYRANLLRKRPRLWNNFLFRLVRMAHQFNSLRKSYFSQKLLKYCLKFHYHRQQRRIVHFNRLRIPISFPKKTRNRFRIHSDIPPAFVHSSTAYISWDLCGYGEEEYHGELESPLPITQKVQCLWAQTPTSQKSRSNLRDPPSAIPSSASRNPKIRPKMV